MFYDNYGKSGWGRRVGVIAAVIILIVVLATGCAPKRVTPVVSSTPVTQTGRASCHSRHRSTEDRYCSTAKHYE